MKKRLALLLVLCLCFALVACGTNDGGDLDAVSGWWTKPDGYDGITILYTFFVDTEREIVISYDDYGSADEEYPCWYDESGFTIDCGEPFGAVTYILDGDTLLDEEGGIRFVRCEPIDPDEPPLPTGELTGTWYKNGEMDETAECLVLESNGYESKQYGISTESGNWSLTTTETYYNDFKHTGTTVEFENEEGFASLTLWVLEDGHILYDGFHDAFYIKDGLDSGVWAALCEKYALVRDSWVCEEDGSTVQLTFFGEVFLTVGSSAESIGQWEMTGGTLRLAYADGSTQECSVAHELTVDYCGKSFVRQEAW